MTESLADILEKPLDSDSAEKLIPLINSCEDPILRWQGLIAFLVATRKAQRNSVSSRPLLFERLVSIFGQNPSRSAIEDNIKERWVFIGPADCMDIMVDIVDGCFLNFGTIPK